MSRFVLAKISLLASKCYEKLKKSKKNPPRVTSKNVSFNKCILIFLFQMILLRVMMYTAKQLFFAVPPEIYRHSLNFQCIAMKI